MVIVVVTEGAEAAKVGGIRAHDTTRKAKRKILDVMLVLVLSLEEKENRLVVVTAVVVVMVQQQFIRVGKRSKLKLERARERS